MIMRIEKLCVEFFKIIVTNHTYDVKLMSTKMDNNLTYAMPDN